MGEYMAMQQDLRDYAALQKAVIEYLDDVEDADINGDRQPWPLDLERLVGWKPRDQR